MNATFIHPTSQVDISVKIGLNTKIWNYSQICEGVMIGSNVVVGRNVYIGNGVVIGNNCKIQNNALLYEPSIIESGVFIGPSVVLTNDSYPRAINLDESPKDIHDWNKVGVIVRKGASIGAGSVCIAPLEIGEWALIAAGSIVTRNVSDFSLVAGVPAKRIGWVGKAGVPLTMQGNGRFVCPKTGATYLELDDNKLVEEV